LLEPLQSLLAGGRCKKIENAFGHDRSDFSHDAAIFVTLAFGFLSETRSSQPLDDFSLLFFSRGVITDNALKQFRIGYVIKAFVKTGDLVGGCFVHLGNGESIEPARKWQGARALNRVHRFRRILL